MASSGLRCDDRCFVVVAALLADKLALLPCEDTLGASKGGITFDSVHMNVFDQVEAGSGLLTSEVDSSLRNLSRNDDA